MSLDFYSDEDDRPPAWTQSAPKKRRAIGSGDGWLVALPIALLVLLVLLSIWELQVLLAALYLALLLPLCSVLFIVQAKRRSTP